MGRRGSGGPAFVSGSSRLGRARACSPTRCYGIVVLDPKTLQPVWRRYYWSAVLAGAGIAMQVCAVLLLPRLGFVALLGAGVVFSVGFLRVAYFRCPACGGLFHQKGWFSGGAYLFFSPACVHCGFPRWADPPGSIR